MTATIAIKDDFVVISGLKAVYLWEEVLVKISSKTGKNRKQLAYEPVGALGER